MNHQTNHSETAPSVHDPIRAIEVAGKLVTIRELSWTKALKFMQMLSRHAGGLINERGQLSIQVAKLPELIVGVEELSRFLMIHSTMADEEWLDSLSFSQGCEVLDAALSVNLNEEVIGKAKKPAGRFAQALGVDGTKGKPTTSQSPDALIS